MLSFPNNAPIGLVNHGKLLIISHASVVGCPQHGSWKSGNDHSGLPLDTFFSFENEGKVLNF